MQIVHPPLRLAHAHKWWRGSSVLRNGLPAPHTRQCHPSVVPSTCAYLSFLSLVTYPHSSHILAYT